MVIKEKMETKVIQDLRDHKEHLESMVPEDQRETLE